MAPKQPPKSLLSFLYHIRYDEQVRRDFHEDEIEVMERFGLPEQLQDLMRAIGRQETGSAGGALPEWKHLLDVYLAPELHDSRDIIW